jgi:Alcohol dehydrogenase transcription factor Myb/SANT-like
LAKLIFYRNQRQVALEKIAEIVSGVRPNTTANQVKIKLKRLRTQFLESLNKGNASKNKSGSGTDSLYVPTLWCFDQLHFLEQHTVHFKGVSNISTQATTQDQVKHNTNDWLQYNLCRPIIPLGEIILHLTHSWPNFSCLIQNKCGSRLCCDLDVPY